MSGPLGDSLVTKVLGRGETAARIGQKRLLVAFQGEAPVPAAGVDRYNRTAIAMQSIRLDQAAFFTQFRFALMRALASSMSFRMSAVRATFGGLPALIMA